MWGEGTLASMGVCSRSVDSRPSPLGCVERVISQLQQASVLVKGVPVMGDQTERKRVEIVYAGLQPGEKLHEVLFSIEGAGRGVRAPADQLGGRARTEPGRCRSG